MGRPDKFQAAIFTNTLALLPRKSWRLSSGKFVTHAGLIEPVFTRHNLRGVLLHRASTARGAEF